MSKAFVVVSNSYEASFKYMFNSPKMLVFSSVMLAVKILVMVFLEPRENSPKLILVFIYHFEVEISKI